MEASGVPRGIGSMIELGVEGSDGQRPLHGDPVMEAVQRSYEAAAQRGSSLSIVVAGLDGFRTVNDYLGPIEGDAVLTSFATRVGACLGEVMHLYGDQLMGVLPGKDAQVAVTLVESLRDQVGGSLACPIGRVTASSHRNSMWAGTSGPNSRLVSRARALRSSGWGASSRWPEWESS